MSHKHAKARRRQGLDRRKLSEQKNLAGLAKPKSPTMVIDPATVAIYKMTQGLMDDILLGEDGLLRVLPASAYDEIPRPLLQLWAMDMGYHLLPTQELVDWLREEIGGARALEICAGAGVLGRALGTICVDWDVCGRFPFVRAHYEALGQTVPMIGGHCLRMEALEAVATYEPQVVFGGYVTQRLYPGEPTTMAGSFAGVDERTLIECVSKYIVVGTRATHGTKKIANKTSRELSPPWLVTRTPDPTDQVIYVWENPDPRPVREVLRIKPEAPIPVPSVPPSSASPVFGAPRPAPRMLR